MYIFDILILVDPNRVILLLCDFQSGESEIPAFLLPKGYFRSSSANFWWNRADPQHKPSSHGCRWGLQFSVGCHAKQSAGIERCRANPSCSKLCLSSRNQRKGASTLPYAPLSNLTISLGPSFIFSLISLWRFHSQNSSAFFSSSENAVLMSKLWIVHSCLRHAAWSRLLTVWTS